MNVPAQLAAIVEQCAAGELSLPVALMELLIATENADEVSSWLVGQNAASPTAAALSELFVQNEAGCRRVATMLRADVDKPPPSTASIEDGVAFCRTLFDWSVKQSEEASVALYSLGNPALLQAATDEIVDYLRAAGALQPHHTVLDFGCGTGRLEVALAPWVRHIVGIDVSAQMVAAAQRNCAHLSNVTVATCSGLDLADFSDQSFDTVLSVDSFPYVVQSGWALVERCFSEATRVLRPQGQFIVLNFSYRGDDHQDQADVQNLAQRHGLALVQNGSKSFRLWNGRAYRFAKPASLATDRPTEP